ncbi:MAG: DUF975 family protein [Lachnospiraceae bacterium]|nr:DUF975 family protein [Lachnospiraceae bacterium]
MWTRKELKEKAKAALKRNYWKAVLVALVVLLIGGGASSSSSSYTAVETSSETAADAQEEVVTDIVAESGSVEQALENHLEEIDKLDESDTLAVLTAYLIVFALIFVVILAFALTVSFLVYNPLLVGAQKFMLKSVDGEGEIKDLAYTFDHNYKNGVKTLFFRDLHVFLWALLFVIPGVYKKYQYYMVEYILAENPDMPYKEVLARSKEMMDGQKWKAFVLDLSFILWEILGIFTCGILDIFFTRPYMYLTRAALYRELNGDTQDTVEAIEMQEI